MKFSIWMRNVLGVVLLIGLSHSPGGAAWAQEDQAERPRNLILLIPDGCGPASMTLGRLYADRPLVLDEHLVGAAMTHATDRLITDSAAAATAYATGYKTYYRAVGVDPDGRPVRTILQALRDEHGMKTGLVTNTPITHATPAAFASHVEDRRMTSEIAEQLLEQGVDLLLGGGRDDFLPEADGGRRDDGRDLLAEARERGYQVLQARSDFDGELRLPVLGLFQMERLAFEIERDPAEEPGVREMAEKAIELLSEHEEGFFLMIEGGLIDRAGHFNDPAAHAVGVVEFDDAFAAAIDFAKRDGRTLVVSVADHETGGLAVGRAGARPDLEKLRRISASVETMQAWRDDGADLEEMLAEHVGLGLPEDEQEAAELEELRGRAFLRALATYISRETGIGWTTWSHTAVDVGVYAYGPGAERFGGTRDNAEIGQILFELFEVEPGHVEMEVAVEAAGD